MFSEKQKWCNSHIECTFCGSSLSILSKCISNVSKGKALKSNSQLSKSIRARIQYLQKVDVWTLGCRPECWKWSHTVMLLAALRYIWKPKLNMLFLQWGFWDFAVFWIQSNGLMFFNVLLFFCLFFNHNLFTIWSLLSVFLQISCASGYVVDDVHLC